MAFQCRPIDRRLPLFTVVLSFQDIWGKGQVSPLHTDCPRVNPRPVEGDETPPPPPCFLKIYPKLKQITTRNLPKPLRATMLHIVSKNLVPRHNRSAVNDVRVTSCSAGFDKNKGWRLTGIVTTGAVLKLRSIVLYEICCYLLSRFSAICYLGFAKFWKVRKNFQNTQHYLFFKNFPSNLKKTNMLEGNGWWIFVQNFKSISSEMAEIWHKTCQKQTLFTVSFWDLTVISKLYILTNFDSSLSVLGSFFAFFAKIWPKKHHIAAPNHEFFAWPFLPGDLRWPSPLDSNDVRKIAKLMNTQRFDISSFSIYYLFRTSLLSIFVI